MAVKTLGSRINTESFSHASGSVPQSWKIQVVFESFFPRKWECSCRKAGSNLKIFSVMQKKDIAISGVFFVTHFMSARAVQSTLYLTYRLPVEPPIDFEYRKKKNIWMINVLAITSRQDLSWAESNRRHMYLALLYHWATRQKAGYCELAACQGDSFNFSLAYSVTRMCRSDVTAELRR